MIVSANLETVHTKIAVAAKEAQRPADSVELVAVSKTQPAQAVEAALQSGQLVFGENRVQEAQEKFPALKQHHRSLRVHLIGPLQTNKARQAVELFDVIESLDRPKLARVLAKEMEHCQKRPDCLIQVNTGEEPQKAGVVPADLPALLTLARQELSLPVVGLMCIPPQDEPPALHFALLVKLAKQHDLKALSMGMSSDYETAIRFGATSVRVGTGVFGPRQVKP
ncbi:MAG: YggS family pyridoxal phosphate-dependent enzyme [Pseudomonadota bacterium]